MEMDGCVGEDGIWVKDGLERDGVDVARVRVIGDEVSYTGRGNVLTERRCIDWSWIQR